MGEGVSDPDDTIGGEQSARRGDGAASPVAGDRVGRYHVDGQLGVGGQGVVLVARDPELDRRVALKLLHVRQVQLHARLLREGRALARLEHPNIVRVFDVGEHEGRIFLAMELVDGVDLANYWARERLAPAERVATLVDAGRGLAAVHDAGLVHRDFKPSNVMVAPRGAPGGLRVAVTDFGLARELDQASTDPNTRTDPRARVGTPGYMAPEQLVRADVDARADQFAFCVALYEAWYGVRPFAGRDLEALFGAMIRRVGRPPAGAAPAPKWLRRILARGLDPDPDRRFPSMHELVDALAVGPPRSRVPIAVAVLGFVVGGAIAVVRAPLPGPSTATASLGPTIAALVRPSTAWSHARIETALAEVTQALNDADAARAREIALRVEADADARGDALLATAAAELRGRAEIDAGDLARGQRTAEAALQRARALGDDFWHAAAAMDLADAALTEGRKAESEQWLRQAESAAIRGDLPSSTISRIELRRAVLAYRVGDFDGAMAGYYGLFDLADPGAAGDEMRASIFNNIGAVKGALGDFRGATRDFDAALALYQDTMAPGHPVLAVTESNLAMSLLPSGQHELGFAHLRSAVARVRAALGPDHPALAKIEVATANGFSIAGDDRSCVEHARSARDLVARVGGDPSTAIHARHLESSCLLLMGDPAGAEAVAAAAITALDGLETGDDIAARARFAYARAAWVNGNRDAAIREAARALVESRDAPLVYEIARWLAEPSPPPPHVRWPPR